MTITMMLVLSLVWGGIVVVAAAALQRVGLGASIRQMMWRFAAVLLAAPYLVAIAYAVIGPEIIEPAWRYGDASAPAIPVVLDALPSLSAPTVAEKAKSFSLNPTLIIGLIIAAGWLVRAVRARWAARELARITDQAQPVKSHRVLASAERWSKKFTLWRQPELKLMPKDFSPFTQGVVRPVVYFPHGLERELGENAMDMVVGHELMHIKRMDALWRPLERLVADVFWFNPFAWFIRAELDRSRELACDAAMLRNRAPAQDYARALVSIARFSEGLSRQAPAAAMFPFNKDKELAERVKIAALSGGSKSSKFGLVGFALFVLGGLPLAVAHGAGGPRVREPIPDFSHTVITAEKAKVSSGYGEREHPVTGELKFHKGVDIAAAEGTPIYAPADGRVQWSGEKDGYGLAVKLAFNDEWRGVFSQMSKIEVREDEYVKAGQKIGEVGMSGKYATGPHLHFELWGPGKSFDEDGGLLAWDPARLGVAMVPSMELNAAQIRRLGVVLPKGASAPPAPPKTLNAPVPAPAQLAPEAPDGGVVDVAPEAVVVFVDENGEKHVLMGAEADADGVSKDQKIIEHSDFKFDGDFHFDFANDFDDIAEAFAGDDWEDFLEDLVEAGHNAAEIAEKQAEIGRERSERAREMTERLREYTEEARERAKERAEQAREVARSALIEREKIIELASLNANRIRFEALATAENEISNQIVELEKQLTWANSEKEEKALRKVINKLTKAHKKVADQCDEAKSELDKNTLEGGEH